METMQIGYDSGDKALLHAFAYVSFQELATRISHRNTGRFTGDPIAERLLARVATDENLHMVFYRDLVTAALEIAPNETLQAITDEVVGFTMPGSIIPGFARKAALIAKAGIYDMRIHHDEVVLPLLRQWGVFHLEALDAMGEKARTELADHLTRLDAQASRFEGQRAEAAGRAAARAAESAAE
jgi:acyl-[acyl-carrier-protein] desaturase